MDIHRKSVDMDMDMDVKFHIHGNPVIRTLVAADMIFDRPPSDACVSAMHASGDQ